MRLLFAYWLVPLGYILFYQQFFQLEPKIIPSHLVLAWGSLSLLLLGAMALHSGSAEPGRSLRAKIGAILLGGWSVAYTIIAGLSYCGMTYNRECYTLKLFFGYLTNLPPLLANFGISPALWMAVLLGIPATLLIGHLLAARRLAIVIGKLRTSLRFQQQRRIPLTLGMRSVFAVAGAGFVLGVSSTHLGSFVRSLSQQQEPIIASLTPRLLQPQPAPQLIAEEKIRAAYPRNLTFDRKNVIIICVDALRADRLSLNGYKRETSPFLDGLYQSGKLAKADLAFSNAAESFGGIMSILRSKTWPNLGFRDFALQDVLKSQSYTINFIVTGDHTRFYNLRSFYGNALDYYADGGQSKHFGPNDDRMILEALDKVPNPQGPSFFYFHLNSAHAAGIKLEQYARYLPALNNQRDTISYGNRYDNGILQADAMIKQLFDVLKAKGYLDHCLLVITADHGEGLGERGFLGHNKDVGPEQTLIPLFFYDSDPSFTFGPLKFASQIDIAPTLLQRLGLPIPESWEGISLLQAVNEKYVFQHAREMHSIIHYRPESLLKYVYNGRTGQEAVYDLKCDFNEKRNLIQSVDSQYLGTLKTKMQLMLR